MVARFASRRQLVATPLVALAVLLLDGRPAWAQG
jgi:hypothetical protein